MITAAVCFFVPKYDNYSNPWFVDDEGRLECIGCKFGEYSLWMQILYDQFFDPRGYDVHVDLDFWEEEAKYAKQFREEHPPECITK